MRFSLRFLRLCSLIFLGWIGTAPSALGGVGNAERSPQDRTGQDRTGSAILTTTLPSATQAKDYSAKIEFRAAGSGSATLAVGDCKLPPGLSLDPKTGRLQGKPTYSGVFPLTLQLVDGQDTRLDEVDLTLRIKGIVRASVDFDQDGDVDEQDVKEVKIRMGKSRPNINPPELSKSLPQGRAVFEADRDTWIREYKPDQVYENDLISVWSSKNTQDHAKRVGVIHFDLSRLKGQQIRSATLDLFVTPAGTHTAFPVKTTAALAPGNGTGISWDEFHSRHGSSLVRLEGFRHKLGAGENGGEYAISSPATKADSDAVRAAIEKGNGHVTFVVQPVEDGTDYRVDWGDADRRYAPRLTIIQSDGCFVATDALPEATLGEKYSATFRCSEGCEGKHTWEISLGSLPAGLHLDAATGRITGRPEFGGSYPFRIRASSRIGDQVSEADVSIAIHTSRYDIDRDGDVDQNDLKVVESSFTGSLDPDFDLCWRKYVTTCLDTLIEHGTDRYGPVKTPMLMAILDVNTLDSPENPPMLDGNVRTEGRPSHGRRSPGGSNLWHDMPTIRVMYRATEVTGDPKYAKAADDYLKAVWKHAVKRNGMLAWGSHIYYHAFKDRPGGDGDGKGPHEILIKLPEWKDLHRANPAAFQREIDGIWKWHIIDKKTGVHNRHDDGRHGCDFAFSGGSFALAFASMYTFTKEESYLDKAKLVAGWHWKNRNKKTGLIPDAPDTGTRYDALHCFTSVTGPHVAQLLRCYEITGDTYFWDLAVSYIKAYEKYGWDEKAGSYYGMLRLDGTPVPQQKLGAGYDVYKPTGYVDVWRTGMYSYEFPIIAAQSSVYACQLATNEQERKLLLDTALHWAHVIRNNLPAKTGRRHKDELEKELPEVKKTGGTYAENYGRAISFFVGLYHVTEDSRHLRRAKLLAREAIEKLYVNGIFRGHPAKDYYQANDGVGFLLNALMELDALPGKWRPAF